jgi:hypothetical protein
VAVLSSNPSTLVAAGTWTSGASAYLSDNVYATNVGTTQNTEYPLEVGGFAFSGIPAGSTINSVTVTVEAKTGTAARAQIRAELLDGATLLSGALALTSLTAADANYTFTSTATLAQLQSANLKVRVINKRIASQATTTSVDWVKIDVDYTVPQPAVSQAAYQFYADNGNLITSTPLAAQDTAPTGNLSVADLDTHMRIRVQAGAQAVAIGTNFQLQFEKNASGTWTNLTTASATAAAYDSANLQDGNGITPRMTGGTGNASSGQVAETGVVLNRPLSANNYMELLYTIRLKKADLVDGDTVRFRALINGVPFATYAQTPTISISTAANPTYQASGTTPIVSAASGYVTIPGAPPQIPTAGLTGWYDADDASTFTFSSGTLVAQWRDKSGLGRHFAQSAVALQPSRSGVQNGRATVVFDVDDYLDTAAFTQPQPITVALMLDASTDNLQGWFSSVGGEYQTWIGNGLLGFYAGTVVQVPTSYSGIHRWLMTATGAASTVHRDGTQILAGDIGSTGTSTGFRTAERNLTAGYRINAPVFEIIVYDRVLSPAERAEIDDYLVAKWITGPTPGTSYPASGSTMILSTAGGAVTARLPASTTTPILFAASGAVTAVLPASASTAIASGASGGPIAVHPVSATTVIRSDASGAVAVRLAAAGSTAILSAATGDVTVIAGAVTLQASASTAILSGASGDAAVRLLAAGTTAILSGAAGDAVRATSASGTTGIVSAASGDIASRQSLSASTRILSGATGDVTGAHTLSGTTPIVFAAEGAGFIGRAAAGSTVILSGSSGAPTLRAAGSGTTEILAEAGGAANIGRAVSASTDILTAGSGEIIARHQASATTPIVSGSAGAAVPSGFASGTNPIRSAASGAIVAALQASGSTEITSGSEGGVSIRRAMSGTTAIVSGAGGDAGAGFGASGTTAIRSAASGGVTAQLRTGGTTVVVSAASGAVSRQLPAAAVTEILSGAAGALRLLLTVAGTTVILSGASGSVTQHAGGGGNFPAPPLFLDPDAPELTLHGTAPARLTLAGAAPVLTLSGELIQRELELVGAAELLTLEGLT